MLTKTIILTKDLFSLYVLKIFLVDFAEFKKKWYIVFS